MSKALAVTTKEGQKKKDVTLPAFLFGIEPNEHVMHEAVRTYLANQRSGTVKTKTRSEVSGGGRKPWRQKGTGRARIGSSRVAHWRGGGLAFGPRPRDHSMRLPKKMRRLALRSALSSKAAMDEIRIIEDIVLTSVSTKEMAGILKSVGIVGQKALLVMKDTDKTVLMSSRNIRNLKVGLARELNTYDLLHAEIVVMTESALGAVEEVFGE
ncbi:50S ribosomal protein L4 [bacterium]|jgi:large subunit ribosomal protein L4|nr:50S ribosomal protein L4 [bacterium]